MINVDHKEDIIARVKELLETQDKIAYSFDRGWTKNFPKEPGVYAFFIDNELSYIGETAEIKSRMSDSRRTYNHSFRKKVGRIDFDSEVFGKKFPEPVEASLNSFFEEKVSVSFVAIDFGRLEIESELIDSYPDGQLYNSIGKRGK